MTSPNGVALTNAQNTLQPLKWPLPAHKVTSAVSLPDLLIGLQFLATDADRVTAVREKHWDGETPASMQVIKSGAMLITRAWTKRTAAAGGIVGLLALAGGTINTFVKKAGEPITVAFIGAGGLILAAAAIAIAIFVKSDLDARGRATAARHAGRAEVAAAFLKATAALSVTGECPDGPDGPGPSGTAGALSDCPDGDYVVRLKSDRQVTVTSRLT